MEVHDSANFPKQLDVVAPIEHHCYIIFASRLTIRSRLTTRVATVYSQISQVAAVTIDLDVVVIVYKLIAI